MTARRCFSAKIAAGRVSARAGQALLDTLDAFEASSQKRLGRSAATLRAAAQATAEDALGKAVRQADLINRTIRAQSDIMRGVHDVETRLNALRSAGKAPAGLAKETRAGTYTALSAFLDADPHELATYNSVAKLTEDLIGRAHATFADGIAAMRSKMLGFKREAVLELDVLRAAFGRTDVSPAARAVAEAWFTTNDPMAERFKAAGGDLFKRERYFPNPEISEAKVRALGEQSFKALAREVTDVAALTDLSTGRTMNAARFEGLLDDAWRKIDSGVEQAAPSAAARGQTMLANSRSAARLFQMKDAESWIKWAEAVGEHTSPYHAMVQHIEGLARDTALLEILGPNPKATLRFMLDVLGRDPGRLAVRAEGAGGDVARAARVNEKTASRNRGEMRSLENLYAEVSGENRIPVATESARRFADARSLLVGAQLGSAMISSLNDPGTLLITARMAGLPIMNVLRWAAESFKPGGERFAATTGMIMDTLAHTLRGESKVLGDTIRSGRAAQLGAAVIRGSGLRRWTEALKAGHWLGSLATVADQLGNSFRDLDPRFREGLERVGVDQATWTIWQQAQPYEPRPDARFLRPADVAALGGEAERAAQKLAQWAGTWGDQAVLEAGPRLRALVIGQSRPGSVAGELRRGLAMYRFFAGAMIYQHGAYALARGWDGSRLGHAAALFVTVSLLGALSMQAKEIVAGRDPLTLDPTKPHGLAAWGKAVLQGGGLGVFGDILQVDQTKYGNSWASTFAGPMVGAVETVFGDFLLKNARLWAEGRPTHFAGDALYAAARYMPGTSLWYGRLAFQRAVLDQLALMLDDRTRERFARIEERAQKDFGQSYWWRPGRGTPMRSPALAGGQ